MDERQRMCRGEEEGERGSENKMKNLPSKI